MSMRNVNHLLLISSCAKSRGSNVYYSVNRPCPVSDRQGRHGKCSADDIVAIRALAFDIDFKVKKDAELVKTLLAFIDERLITALRPSLVIDSGGGFQLIYLLSSMIDVQSYPHTRRSVTDLANDFEALLTSLATTLPIKIDNMSNVDRVMRLPGTVNYPKAEKRAKGQVEALAHIIVNYGVRCDIRALRDHVPIVHVAPTSRQKKPYVQRPDDPWTPFMKAQYCCEYVRDYGIADTNGWYSYNVMFPLLGEAANGNIAWEEAEELFMTAVSGGERYGVPGRGLSYFMRQWKSHLHSSRNGSTTLGTLIDACKKHGMPTPWKDVVSWEASFEEQLAAIHKLNETVDNDIVEMINKVVK